MKAWRVFALGLFAGISILVGVSRLLFTPSAQAQYLSKFQNVQFDFNTTGAVSTLTFFNRETGEIFVYIASGTSDFKFARRMTLQELGGPIQIGLNRPSQQRIPPLQEGLDLNDE
jgi:hypothetical protein